MMKMTAHKARYGGGITGSVTAIIMLVFHFAGLVELSTNDLTAVAVAIGSGIGSGIVAFLSVYRSPPNQAKPEKT